MIGYLKRFTIRNIVSPYGLATVSYLVFLCAWLFPPGLYTEYIHEPDLMFLEPVTFAFFTLCTVAFLVGVRVSPFFVISSQRRGEAAASARNPLLYVLPPLLAAASFSAVYLVKMGGKINLVALLASQQGNTIKAAGGTGQMSEGRWDESVPFLTVVLWWSLYRAMQLKLRGASRVIFSILFLASTALGIAVGIATVNRGNLMPIILGTLVVYIYPRTRKLKTRVVKLALTGAAGSVGTVAAFLLMSFLRGAVGLNLLVTAVLGYTIVSYNRMAALLTGVMHYAYEGRNVYLFPFLLGDEKFDFLFHFADRFGWPTSLGLWQTEFSSTSAAALNPAFIWSGAFGYVYSDIGWATPFYWCALGVIAGCVWAKFSDGRSVGLVLYPWVAFSILMWCGPNFMFRTNFIQYCEFAVALTFYDSMLLRRLPATPGEVARSPVRFMEPVCIGADRGIF